jgi:tetrapyrrole methylase family protein / MazG family protein
MSPLSAVSLLPLLQALQVVAELRHPEHGCPWDLKQTHASLKRYLLEETQETLTAIDEETPSDLCEELGDVLLQVLLHSQIAQDNHQFTFADVCQTLAQKLVSRHPHVFAQPQEAITIDSADAVTRQWQQIKATEKGRTGRNPHSRVLADVPKGLPALSRALATSKKAVAVGFEWPNLDSLWQCVMSEYDEFKAVVDDTTLCQNPVAWQDRLEDEMGDILFASINLGRHFGVDPEVALHRAVDKFTRRFQAMEDLMDIPLSQRQTPLTFEEWDTLWNQAKVFTKHTVKDVV